MSVSHSFSVQIAAKRRVGAAISLREPSLSVQPTRIGTPSSIGPPTVRNEPAPPKWSKGWTDLPQASNRVGAYTAEELERMNQDFTAAVERAFRTGGESEKAATATYDLRRLIKV
jgi:hypothetical protein